MQVTLDLDDELLVVAERRAAEEGRTLRSLVEEALRARLTRRSADDADADDAPAPLPRFRPARPGVRPGADFRDNELLRDVTDGG